MKYFSFLLFIILSFSAFSQKKVSFKHKSLELNNGATLIATEPIENGFIALFYNSKLLKGQQVLTSFDKDLNELNSLVINYNGKDYQTKIIRDIKKVGGNIYLILQNQNGILQLREINSTTLDYTGNSTELYSNLKGSKRANTLNAYGSVGNISSVLSPNKNLIAFYHNRGSFYTYDLFKNNTESLELNLNPLHKIISYQVNDLGTIYAISRKAYKAKGNRIVEMDKFDRRGNDEITIHYLNGNTQDSFTIDCKEKDCLLGYPFIYIEDSSIKTVLPKYTLEGGLQQIINVSSELSFGSEIISEFNLTYSDTMGKLSKYKFTEKNGIERGFKPIYKSHQKTEIHC